MNSKTNVIYATYPGTSWLVMINGETSSMLTPIQVELNSYGVAVNSNTGRAYVTDLSSNTVHILDSSLNAIATIPSSEPFAVAVDPITNRVYVTNLGSGTVTVIDGSTYHVLATVSVSNMCRGTCPS